jgi:hypothetical protein
MTTSPRTQTPRAARKATGPDAQPPVVEQARKAAAPAVKKPAAKRVAKTAAVASVKPAKLKLKLVRDSFTMPQADFELIDMLKQRALDFRHSVKKSELLRAGLQVLAALPHAQLQAALERITPLKPGRPKKPD